MKRMARAVFAVSAAFGALLASASPAAPVDAFKSALGRALDADASWTMVKSFGDSPLRFRFEGMVSCAAGKGVVWSMERPLRSRIVMSERGMEFSGDGKGRRKVDPGELPHYLEIRQAIDGFLSGGEMPLGKIFDMSCGESHGKWRVELLPRRFDMRGVIKSVSVSGAETIENVEFRYASGENAKIEFRETARGAHSLWKALE